MSVVKLIFDGVKESCHIFERYCIGEREHTSLRLANQVQMRLSSIRCCTFSIQRVLALLVLASACVGEENPPTTRLTEAVTPTHRPPDDAGRLARLGIRVMVVNMARERSRARNQFFQPFHLVSFTSFYSTVLTTYNFLMKLNNIINVMKNMKS